MELKELRIQSGLKAYKVAEYLGITRQQLNNIEKGVCKIDKLKQEKLSKLYSKEIEEIKKASLEVREKCLKMKS